MRRSLRLLLLIAGVSLCDGDAAAQVFSVPGDGVLEKNLNRMWQVFGTADDGVVAAQGNESGWAEWNALKFAWSAESAQQEKLGHSLLAYPMSKDGYVWSWKSEEGWPTHHHRHFDTNSKYILGVWRHVLWQGGKGFLDSVDPKEFKNKHDPEKRDVSMGLTVMEKCRRAMAFQLKELRGAEGLLVIPSDESDGTVNGKPTDYWDNFLFGHKSAYANIYFYASLNAMLQLEQAFGDAGKATEYAALMPKVKSAFNQTFWDYEKGRYIGCVDVDGREWDFGFTYLNLEAIVYGLASRKQAEAIFQWLDGERIIPSDIQRVGGKKTGTTGKDIYDLVWAPHSTTRAVESLPMSGKYWWWDIGGKINVAGEHANAVYGEHVENGGAILYVSFYDLLARLEMLGADNSFERLSAIVDEFAKDELRRDPKNSAGARWVWGLTGVFPESGLMPTFLIHGYLGLTPTVDGIAVAPNLPTKLPSLKLNEASWRGHRFSVSATRNAVRPVIEKMVFQSLEKVGTPIRVECRKLQPGGYYQLSRQGAVRKVKASADGTIGFLLMAGARMEMGTASGMVASQGIQKRPNIVFMLADDLRADAVGYAGNEVVQTPNIDKLAKGGLSFSHAFVTSPICAVSRACILSGQYARRNGVEDFDTPVDLDKTYPSVLRKNGYYTGFMGKWGVDAGNMDYLAKAAESFDFWAGCANQSNFWHEEDCRWVKHDGKTAKADFHCDCPADKNGRTGENVRSGFKNMVNPIHLETVVFPRKMRAFLETRDKSKPFCMSISYKSPHGPWQDWDRKYANLYKGQKIPMKPTATLEAAARQPQFLQESLESDRARDWMKRGIYNSWYQHYYRSVTGMDNSIGQIRELLREHGLEENTVIIFTSDNGHFMGEHGFGGKWLLYEESIQVPFLIYDPRLPENRRGRVSEAMALNVDIYPTIAGLAGVNPPVGLQGKSLLPLLENPDAPLRAGSFFEHHFSPRPPRSIAQSEGIRSKDWKYIRYTERDPVVEELYGLRSDPLEENNLAANPENRKILDRFRSAWEKQRKELR